MAEEQVIVEEKKPEVQDYNTQLQESIWNDKPLPTPVQEEKKPEIKEEKKEEVIQPTEAWFKQYGFEDEAKAKENIETWKKAAENPVKEEIKFANDQSKLLFEYLKEGKEDEALAIINTKKRIDKLTAGEVTEANAADILKLSIQNKYKEFNDDDINRKFNKQYGLPKEPVFDEAKETEDEFKNRQQEWKEKVQEIKSDLLLDAKIAKTELAKLNTELVLPDISKPNQESNAKKEPTQEELQAFKKVKENWTSAATKIATEFSGLTTTAKYKEDGKDVELSVSYGLSEDEKKGLIGKLTAFAEGDFDPYAIFKERWVNADGTDNMTQMVKDLSRVFYGESAEQKFASEAANQRMEAYIKGKKHIKVDGSGGQEFKANGEKSQSEKLQENFWGS